MLSIESDTKLHPTITKGHWTNPRDWHYLVGINVTHLKNFPTEQVKFIQPSNPLHRNGDVINLSLIDHMMRNSYTTTLFAFPNTHAKRGLSEAQLLHGLQRVVDDMPSISGSLIDRKDGSPLDYRETHDQVQIKLTGTGVWFTCTTTNQDYQEMARDLFSHEVHQPNYQFKAAQEKVINDSTALDKPILAVKVTQFNCGSLIVSTLTQHLVFDYRSTYQIMCRWGQYMRGQLPDAPLVEARRLTYHPPNPESAQFYVPKKASSGLIQPPKQQGAQFKTCRVSIPVHTMAQIKQSIAENLPEGAFVSTDDVVSAAVWRALTRARKLVPDSYTKFQRVLDVRKFSGLEVDTSFGCGIVTFIIGPIKVAHLLSQPISQLSYLFRTETEAQNTIETYHYWLNNINTTKPRGMSSLRVNSVNGPDIIASSYSKIDPSRINFGEGFICNTVARVPYPEGQLHAHRVKNHKNYAMLGVAQEYLHEFMTDHELHSLGFSVDVAPFKN